MIVIVIGSVAFPGNGAPSNAVNVNVNESSVVQSRPSNFFSTFISASPDALYVFVNVALNVVSPSVLGIKFPFPSSTNVIVTVLSSLSYTTPFIVLPLCVSVIVYVYVPASVNVIFPKLFS